MQAQRERKARAQLERAAADEVIKQKVPSRLHPALPWLTWLSSSWNIAVSWSSLRWRSRTQQHCLPRAMEPRRVASGCGALQEDRETAHEQAASRRLVIERVNKMLFNQTDKVKGFHGSVLHCDVLAERAAQIELKGQVRGLRAAQEEAFVRQQREQLQLAEAAEMSKMAEAKARALQQRDAQLAQLDELKASILAEREQNRVEVRACDEGDPLPGSK